MNKETQVAFLEYGCCRILFTLRRCGFAKVPPDWFDKELSGRGLGRKRLSGTSGGRENSGKEKGSLPARCAGSRIDSMGVW